MTPAEYKAQYEDLKINLGGGQTTSVSINKYRLGQPKDGGATRKALMDKIGTGVSDFEVRVGLNGDLQPVEAKLTKTPAFRLALASPYTGKGAPEHCQVVLQLARHYNQATDLQKYADDNLGLDCNGFVGNFLWHIWRANPWSNPGRADKDYDGPDMRLDGYFDVRRQDRVKRWEDINTNHLYLLIRTTDDGELIIRNSGNPIGHIVITEPGQAARAGTSDQHLAIRVMESTASHVPPGLSANWYTCIDEKHAGTAKAIFKIDRGIDVRGPNQQIWFMVVQVQPHRT
jgi:hypothetical protein